MANKNKRINYPRTRITNDMVDLSHDLGRQGIPWAATKERLRSDFKSGRKLNREQIGKLKRIHSGEVIPHKLVKYNETPLLPSSLETIASASVRVPPEGPYHKSNGKKTEKLTLSKNFGEMLTDAAQVVMGGMMTRDARERALVLVPLMLTAAGEATAINEPENLSFPDVFAEFIEEVYDAGRKAGREQGLADAIK